MTVKPPISTQVLEYGDKSVNPIFDFQIKAGCDTIGDDICLLFVGSQKPSTRHYAAYATTVIECFTTDGLEFAKTITRERFPQFYKAIRLHALWVFVRKMIILRIRSGHKNQTVEQDLVATQVLAASTALAGTLVTDVLGDEKKLKKLAKHQGRELLEALDTLADALSNPKAAQTKYTELRTAICDRLKKKPKATAAAVDHELEGCGAGSGGTICERGFQTLTSGFY